MGAIKRIAKNTIYMFTGNIVKKLFTLVLTLIVARYLGAANFGKLSFALGFVVLFSILTDFGAKILINREIARNKDKVNKYVSNVIILKVFLSIVMILVVGAAANILSYPSETIFLVYIAAFIFIFQSLGEPLNSAFRGFEVLQYSALPMIGQSLLKFLLAIGVVILGLGVKELLFAYLIAEILGFLMMLFYYHTKIHKFCLEWDYKFSKGIIKASIPFGVAALMMTLYDKIDITMLSKMVSNPDAVIGWYSAAITLPYVFEFIPISIMSAVYSYASVSYLKDISKLKIVYEKLISYFFYFTIPLCVGTVVLANKIIHLLYGNEYAPAIFALQILIWAVLLKFQMYAFGIVLDSMNKEMLTMKAAIASLVANVGLNLILIPKYGFIGASIATVASEMIYFVICYAAVSVYLERVPLIKLLYKPVFASIIMGVSVYYLNFINLFIAIFLAMIIYISLMFILRAFPKKDIGYVVAYMKGISNKFKS